MKLTYSDPSQFGTPAQGGPVSHQWGDTVQTDVEAEEAQIQALQQGNIAVTVQQVLPPVVGVSIPANGTVTENLTIPAGVLALAVQVTNATATTAGWGHLKASVNQTSSQINDFARQYMSGTPAAFPTMYLDVTPNGAAVLTITNQTGVAITATISVQGYTAPVALVKPPKPRYTVLHEWWGYETTSMNPFNPTFANNSWPTGTVTAKANIMLLGLSVDISGAPNPTNTGTGGSGVTFWEILAVGGYARAGSPAFQANASPNQSEPTTALISPGWNTPVVDTAVVGGNPESGMGPTYAPYPGGLYAIILKAAGPSYAHGVNKHLEVDDLEIPLMAGDQLYFHMAAQTNSNDTTATVDGETQVIIHYAML